MKPVPISFPARYPRGVLLQFPCDRPIFSLPPVKPPSLLRKIVTGTVLLLWLAACAAVVVLILLFVRRSIH